jgi:sugar phosphate permease
MSSPVAPSTATVRPSSKLFYGWVVVGIVALSLVVAAGVRSAPGVFLVPVQNEMGWSRADISFAVSVGLVIFGLTAPLSGRLIDTFGPRKVMVVGLLVVGVSMAMGALVMQLWQLNAIWGVLSGVGTGVVGSVLGATVANRWFVARRGLITGIFGAATSAGQLVFVPALTQLAVNFGWRNASIVLGLIAIALIVPTVILMRNDPADVKVLPLGATAATNLVKSVADPEIMKRAVHTPEFWLLAGTFFVCGATSNGLIGTHFIAHAVDCGIPQVMAASTLAMMGMFNFVGTIASGWLTDRIDPRKLLAVYYSFRGLSLLLLPFVTDPLGLNVFAILFGLDYIATVPPTTALVADKFGRKNVGTVYGWVFCAHMIGAAAASWLGGITRDALGAYTVAFLVAGVIAIMAGALALVIRRTTKIQPA